jgi:hypothetical protein
MSKVDTIAGHAGIPKSLGCGASSIVTRRVQESYVYLEHAGRHYLVDPNGNTLFCSRFRFVRNFVASLLTFPYLYDAGQADA